MRNQCNICSRSITCTSISNPSSILIIPTVKSISCPSRIRECYRCTCPFSIHCFIGCYIIIFSATSISIIILSTITITFCKIPPKTIIKSCLTTTLTITIIIISYSITFARRSYFRHCTIISSTNTRCSSRCSSLTIQCYCIFIYNPLSI